MLKYSSSVANLLVWFYSRTGNMSLRPLEKKLLLISFPLEPSSLPVVTADTDKRLRNIIPKKCSALVCLDRLRVSGSYKRLHCTSSKLILGLQLNVFLFFFQMRWDQMVIFTKHFCLNTLQARFWISESPFC